MTTSRTSPGRRRRVLVARLDSAGDVLLAGPAVRAVAASGASVVMLCSRRGAAVADLLPGVAEVLTFQAPWVLADPAPLRTGAIVRLVLRLRMARIDEAIILTSFHQSALPLALLLRMAGVPLVSAVSEDYPGSLLDRRIALPDDLHEAQRSAAVAAACGYPPVGDGLRVRADLPDVSDLVPRGSYVVVHPGADAPARQWPAARARAAVELMARAGRTAVVTGGPDEAGLTALVAGTAGVDLGGRTSWPQLAAVLRGAEAVVVANTGPAHLACAVGTPVVSLFAPTVPVHRWGPYAVPSVVLGLAHAPCAGSRARACPVPGHPCLSSVSAAEVVDAVRRLTEVAA